MYQDTMEPVGKGTSRNKAAAMLKSLVTTLAKPDGIIGMVVENQEVVAIFIPAALSAVSHAAALSLASSLKLNHHQKAALAWGMDYAFCNKRWAEKKLAENKIVRPTTQWVQFLH